MSSQCAHIFMNSLICELLRVYNSSPQSHVEPELIRAMIDWMHFRAFSNSIGSEYTLTRSLSYSV